MGGECWEKYAPDEPFSPSWYLTVRGGEYVQLYLWILKDLSWTQDWYFVGNIIGSLAVVWGFLMLVKAYSLQNRNEIATGSSQLLWLIANLWWMTGELHDWEFRKETKSPILYPSHTVECGHILQISLVLMLIYYLVLRPLHISAPSAESIETYNETGLDPRCSPIFATWREYENIHVLCWLITDYAWNTLNPSVWVFSGIPTILIAADFVVSSFQNQKLVIDHYHYIAQFMWFLANFVWAFGEIFDPKHDYPYSLFARDPRARLTCRWWSSWCLVVSFVPIVILHVLWIAKTHKLQSSSIALQTINHQYVYTPILPRPNVVSSSTASSSKLHPIQPIVKTSILPNPIAKQRCNDNNYGSFAV